MTEHDTRTSPAPGLAGDILGAPGAGTGPSGLIEAHDELQQAARSLRAAVGHLHESEDEAWQRYAAETDDVMARMEAELAVSAAKLRAERASSRDELHAALEEATRAWRARADELRVQTHLGELDARDAGLVALDRIEAAGHRLTKLIDVVTHETTERTGALQERARRVIDDVRGAVGGLVIDVWAYDDGSPIDIHHEDDHR